MTEMPPMVPSAENRNQAEAIVEAFHNDDLEGSLAATVNVILYDRLAKQAAKPPPSFS